MTAFLGEISAPAAPEAKDGLLSVTYFVPEPSPPAYEEMPGSPLQCKAWEYTPEEFAANEHGVDIGTLQWTVSDGPPMPPCEYVDGRGYTCIGVTGSGGDIKPVPEQPGLFSLTDTSVTFGADQVGRHLEVDGASTAANNGAFPIVGAEGDNTIIFLNEGPGQEELGTSASYQTVAGLGPSGMENPLVDNATVELSLTANADAPIDSFTGTATVPTDFTLNTASQAMLNDIPLDGSEFTIGCSGDGECGSAQASILRILTTDGNVEGLPPNVMPPPENAAVLVLCIVPLSGSVTVPAEASALLQDSGANRVEAVFLRASPAMDADRPWLTLMAPHMQAGFTTP